MNQTKVLKGTIQGKKFQLVIDRKLDVATGKYLGYKSPVSSKELDDFIVLHYESKSGNLIGFTILHLNEFMESVRKLLKKIVKHVRVRERQWLKEKAQQSIYETINNEQPYQLLTIPEPFWHKSRIEKFSVIGH